MPLLPCPNAINRCLPCDDDPIRNLSAEDPDSELFCSNFYFRLTDVPLNNTFKQAACKVYCCSRVSQDEADDCAMRASQQCVYDPHCPDCVGGGPGDPGCAEGCVEDPDGVPIPVFFNSAQSFTVNCPDGTSFTWTIAAGEFIGLSQASANQTARSVAKLRAQQNRICILTARTGVCDDTNNSRQIIAVGGTALFFPYLLGPQTPIGFSGCGENFQPVPYIWSIVSGSLPPGIELDECTGIISGEPTAGGTYTFTVRATDAIGSFQQKQITMCSIAMGPDSLPNGTVGASYLQNLTQTPGDQETETWTLVSGSLPNGLSLSSAGVISGTPEQAAAFQTFAFRVRVTVGSCGSASCEKNYQISIGALALQAYWNMDENAGVDGGPRVDELAGIVLTPSGSITWSAGGKISRAVHMTDVTGLLASQNTEPLLNYSGIGITFFGWIRCTFLVFAGGVGDLLNYKFIDSGGAVIGELDGKYDGDTTTFNCTLTGFGAPISIAHVQNILDSDYHFWMLWYDPADKKLHLSIDNGAVIDSAGALVTDIAEHPNGRLRFAYTGITNLQAFFIDEFGIFTGVPPADCRTDLFNADSGVTWPAVQTTCT